MTMPNGPDGLGPNIALAFPLTVDSTDPNQSLANRDGFDQPTVESMLKEEVKASQGWNSANNAAYDGLLRDGVPLVTNIIFTVVDQIWDMTPLGLLPFHPSDVLDFITGLPILSDIIPGLDASKIISGTFGLDMISGLLDVGGNILDSLIPGLDASKIISGVFGGGLIPGLDASKIISGEFPQSMVTGLVDALAEGAQSVIDAIVGGLGWLTGTGHTSDDVFDAVQNIPGLNIISTVASSIIPGLDASKITSGQFGLGMISGLLDGDGNIVQDLLNIPVGLVSGLLDVGGSIFTSLIPGLDVSKIVSGVFGAGFIPGLDASKIVSGIFGTGLIPGLDASKIVSGIFGTGLIPGLDAAKIVSGVFTSSLVPGLDTSKITTGTFADTIVPGIGSILDSLFNGIFSLDQSGATQTDAATAVQSQTSTIVSNAAQLAQVVASLDSGNTDSDDFERSGSSLGANWVQVNDGGSNQWGTDGHNARYNVPLITLNTQEFIARKNNVQAATDRQKVSMVLDSTPADLVVRGHNDLWLRMTAFTTWATRTGMRCRYSGNGAVEIAWFNNGAKTTLLSTSVSKVAAGTTLTFLGGVGTELHRYQLTIGASPLVDYTDLAQVSAIGTTYRYRGHGGRFEATGLTGASPGRLKQWTASG